MSDSTQACPKHPEIFLPYLFTCPLCAQEQRQVTWAAQKADSLTRLGTRRNPLDDASS